MCTQVATFSREMALDKQGPPFVSVSLSLSVPLLYSLSSVLLIAIPPRAFNWIVHIAHVKFIEETRQCFGVFFLILHRLISTVSRTIVYSLIITVFFLWKSFKWFCNILAIYDSFYCTLIPWAIFNERKISFSADINALMCRLQAITEVYYLMTI